MSVYLMIKWTRLALVCLILAKTIAWAKFNQHSTSSKEKTLATNPTLDDTGNLDFESTKFNLTKINLLSSRKNAPLVNHFERVELTLVKKIKKFMHEFYETLNGTGTIHAAYLNREITEVTAQLKSARQLLVKKLEDMGADEMHIWQVNSVFTTVESTLSSFSMISAVNVIQVNEKFTLKKALGSYKQEILAKYELLLVKETYDAKAAVAQFVLELDNILGKVTSLVGNEMKKYKFTLCYLVKNVLSKLVVEPLRKLGVEVEANDLQNRRDFNKDLVGLKETKLFVDEIVRILSLEFATDKSKVFKLINKLAGQLEEQLLVLVSKFTANVEVMFGLSSTESREEVASTNRRLLSFAKKPGKNRHQDNFHNYALNELNFLNGFDTKNRKKLALTF